VFTNSKIENATLKIKILSFDSEKQKPSKSIIEKDILYKVKKGRRKNLIDVKDYNIKIPKEGIVIGIENLIIEENKYTEKSKVLQSINKENYAPGVILNYVNEENTFSFLNFKWHKIQKTSFDFGNNKGKKMIMEPAINMILTN
jgi:hypothetical protein